MCMQDYLCMVNRDRRILTLRAITINFLCGQNYIALKFIYIGAPTTNIIEVTGR